MLKNPSRWTSRPQARRLLLVLVFALALAAGTPPLLQLARTDPLAELMLTHEPFRRLEARVTHPLADRYRPYHAPASQPPRASLKALASLEDSQQVRELAAAYLLHDWRAQATALLSPALSSPDDFSDLAVVALRDGAFKDALALLDRALKLAPRHPQALWNRALVLRELELSHAAAEAFEQVAQLGEPGWSEEARAQAQRLLQATTARYRDWEAVGATRNDPVKLAHLSPAIAARVPGKARLALYKAVRSCTSREQVEGLLPLARELDRHQGDSALEDYLREVARRDFHRRAPLAEAYARLVQSNLPAPTLFLERARLSGEKDIYLGALLSRQVPSEHLEELRGLLSQSRDPWLRLLEPQELALHEFRAGNTAHAEALLSSALARCDARRMAYRCLDLTRVLVDVYAGLYRLTEAQQLASKSLLAARSLGERALERTVLQQLSLIARLHYEASLSRAYLSASLDWDPQNPGREPKDPRQCRYVHENLANLAMLDFDIAGERAHMAKAFQCGIPLTGLGVYLLAELSRFGVSQVEAEQFHRALADLRREETDAGRQAWLLAIEGQFELERDRPRGRKLLHQAIAEAGRLRDNPEAQEAQAHSYSTLIIDAGRANQPEELFSLVTRDRQLPVPERCAVVVEDDHSRVLTAVRGARGQALLHFDDMRREPLGSGRGLIPDAHIRALQGCQHVQVLASPSALVGTELLPPDLPWSFRQSREPRPTRSHEKRLVVHNVQPPEELGLPSLPIRRLPAGTPNLVELNGPDATPSRVLAEMTEASEIEVHAHGLSRPKLFDTPFIALSAHAEGRYALTAEAIREHRLKQAPVVFLAACGAARRNPLSHEPPMGLPAAFIHAGASAVLAATVDIPDSAGAFFEAVAQRIRSGTAPAAALAAERARWLGASPQESWVRHVLIFE